MSALPASRPHFEAPTARVQWQATNAPGGMTAQKYSARMFQVSPERDVPAVDLHGHRVEALPPAARLHTIDPVLPDRGRDCRAGPKLQQPDRSVAHLQAALPVAFLRRFEATGPRIAPPVPPWSDRPLARRVEPSPGMQPGARLRCDLFRRLLEDRKPSDRSLRQCRDCSEHLRRGGAVAPVSGSGHHSLAPVHRFETANRACSAPCMFLACSGLMAVGGRWPWRSMRHCSLQVCWTAGRAWRRSSVVSNQRTRRRVSFSVRMKRSAQPLPSGARRTAGKFSAPRKPVLREGHLGSCPRCHDRGGGADLSRHPRRLCRSCGGRPGGSGRLAAAR